MAKTANAAAPKRPPLQKGIVKRLLKSLFHYYPVMLPVALVCIVINAAISSVPALFMEQLYTLLGDAINPNNSAHLGSVLTWLDY